MIVMQGLIGGTLGAATERMMGTPAGALVGDGGGISSAHDTRRRIALVLVTCATVWPPRSAPSCAWRR
jgi:hypothetical protein